MANKFDSFFSNIGVTPAKKIPHTDGDISDYLTGNFPNGTTDIIPTNLNEKKSILYIC